MPDIEELSRMIIRAQDDYNRYFNHRMDEAIFNREYQLTVPDDNPVPLDDRIDALAHGTYAEIDRSRVPEWTSATNVINDSNRPNINHRLSARLVNAGNSDITFRILMEAYMIVTYGNIEPDGLWANDHMYMRVRDLIVSQPDFARTFETGTTILLGIRFMAADLHRDSTIPPDEILLFNSRYPEHSARIVNLSTLNLSQ